MEKKANKSMLEEMTKNRGREILRRGYCHKSQERLFHKRERREKCSLYLAMWRSLLTLTRTVSI